LFAFFAPFAFFASTHITTEDVGLVNAPRHQDKERIVAASWAIIGARRNTDKIPRLIERPRAVAPARRRSRRCYDLSNEIFQNANRNCRSRACRSAPCSSAL